MTRYSAQRSKCPACGKSVGITREGRVYQHDDPSLLPCPAAGLTLSYATAKFTGERRPRVRSATCPFCTARTTIETQELVWAEHRIPHSRSRCPRSGSIAESGGLPTSGISVIAVDTTGPGRRTAMLSGGLPTIRNRW